MTYKFFCDLEAELNKRTTDTALWPEWEYCAFGTPTQHVVLYEFGMDDDYPTYVRLVTEPSGTVEDGLHFPMFTVIVSVNGERDTVYEGDDREIAIAHALSVATKIETEWVPVEHLDHGFEHEGLWITDRTKSPCGRFDLTAEESDKLYGKETNNG